MARPRASQDEVLASWTERDLSAAAERGELAPAFEVEAALADVADVLGAGRHPILIGEAGVGKTALVHELVRRAVAGHGLPQFAGRRVLQFSLRQRASGLAKPEQLRPEMQRLVEALAATPQVLPFFRDIHLAYAFDLEPQLLALLARGVAPVLAEGERAQVGALLDNTPELAESFTPLEQDEPRLDRALRIAESWAAERHRRGGRAFAPAALAEAVELTHRFLARARLPRKALDLLAQTAAVGSGEVDAPQVLERFCRAQRVPRLLVDPQQPLDLAELQRHFAGQVLGQGEAVEAVLRMVALVKAGLADARRPFGAFLFVGPTGVGKTHLAQLLAEFLFGSRERLLRLNMADYQKESDAAVLFGDPEAWPPPRRRGLLTQRVWAQPFAVLLLDELEKAHPAVHDRFLQLMDEGSFINGAGELVACRSMILIATSNAGAEVYRGRSLGLVEPAELGDFDREVDRRLLQHFRFEFLNRFDQVVHFHPLGREHIRAIARRELLLLAERPGLARRGVQVEVEESVVDWLAVHGYDPHHGARVLRRTLERHVATALARAIVARGAERTPLRLSVRQGRVAVLPAQEGQERVRERTPVELPAGSATRVRKLDRAALRAEARALLEAGRPRLAALQARQEERSALIAQLNQAGSWDASAQAYRQFERFRELDVAIGAEERLARPLHALERLLEQEAAAPAELARALEAAARALETWQRDSEVSGHAGAWLLIAHLDALHPAGRWPLELARLELAWCRKLGLQAAVAAHEAGEVPALVALDVEGPAARVAQLDMEVGIHRLARGRGAGARAQIVLVPKSTTPAAQPPARIVTMRRRQGPLGQTLACRARLELRARGRVTEWVAADEALLRHLVHDLEQSWSRVDEGPGELARVYAEDGRGARDPRTGAAVARFKDALRGELGTLLEAWLRARAPAAAPDQE